MKIERLALTPIQSRDDVRLLVHNKTNVAQKSRVQNGVHGRLVIVSAVRKSGNAGACGGVGHAAILAFVVASEIGQGFSRTIETAKPSRFSAREMVFKHYPGG